MGITSRLAALAVGMAVLSAPAAAQTPTADELVAKYLTARGGVDKIKAVNTARIAGTVSAAGQDLQLTVVSKRPNKMRQEVMVQGQKMIQAFDGTTAWGVNPMTGNPSPQVMEGPQADLIKTQALFDGPLVGYKERGDTLEVIGPATVEGSKAWNLKLTRKDGKSMNILLDAESGLERQWTATMEQGGMTMEVQTLMSDYQTIDGLQVAKTMRTMIGGQQAASLTFTSVEFNVPVDDAEFVMPK
jgi:outer membrane lipoprotein-sorting protein